MTSALKIVLANSGRRWIGEIGHCALLYSALEARGHQVWIVCRRGMDLESYARDQGLRHLALGFSGRFSPRGDWSDVRALAALMRRESIDVLHVHRGKDHWVGVAAARRVGAPVVRTRHVVTPVAQHALNRWLYMRATRAVLSVSAAAERSLGPLANKIGRRRVILSAVDHRKFNPSHRSDVWRREAARCGPRIEPFWIGLIGRIQGIKGQKEFLRAAAIVAGQLPEAHFLIAGRGGESKMESYGRFAQEHGFADRLRVEGILSNLPEVMASLDLGVVASLGSEGSSRITLELMASGVPVVATRVGGIPEILDPGPRAPVRLLPEGGAFGLLIPPADPEAMAEAMLELIRDSRERRRLALQGRRAAEANHDPGLWAAAIEEVYREVIGTP